MILPTPIDLDFKCYGELKTDNAAPFTLVVRGNYKEYSGVAWNSASLYEFALTLIV